MSEPAYPEGTTAEYWISLKALVASIRSDVTLALNKPSISASSELGKASRLQYPDALPTTLASNIGLVIDREHSALQLIESGLISPPKDLAWLTIRSYVEFETFLDTRGIPAYISFGGSLDNPTNADKGVKLSKPRDSVACAHALIRKCGELRVTKLPEWNVHCPLITKKQQIELLLFDYRPKSVKNDK